MNVAVTQRACPEPALQAAMACGYTELQARIIASRLPHLVGEGVASTVSPTLACLDGPQLLPDIERASKRLADAIQRRERILIICDHDVDGSTSLAIVRSALCDTFMVAPERVRSYTSHRMREGYGVSDALVDRILAENGTPAIAVTCDQGSTDEVRIARLLEHGIETIVTDHHEIPETGIPASAYAVVNPTRSDSLFPDRSIAGCHVAFLVMCAVREELLRRNVLPPRTPKLSHLLDYAACGTVADCADLSVSHNNRAIVRFGLHLMNSQPRPCWRAMKQLLGRDHHFTAETIGYQIGARINAAGRIDDSMLAVDFLLARNDDEANRLILKLDAMNTERRAVQDRMTEQAMEIAARQAASGVAALVVYLPDGHAGVHGITCGRIAEAFGRPAACFSPKQGAPGVLTGSLRSIPGVHIANALQRTDELAGGGLLRSRGGHRAAGGCTLLLDDLARFEAAFRAAVAEQRDPATMGPSIETDGPIPRAPDLGLLHEISCLEPYGRDFPAPVFHGDFTVRTCKSVGDGRHLKLELCDRSGRVHPGIWFGARASANDPFPVAPGDDALFVFSLTANTYRGATTIDLRVQAARPHHKDCP